MEYNILHDNIIKDDTNNYLKKNTNVKKISNISKLELKIKELEKKIDFYKKYEKKNNDICEDIILKSIDIINQTILSIDKNIILKGQFNRNKLIEFEF